MVGCVRRADTRSAPTGHCGHTSGHKSRQKLGQYGQNFGLKSGRKFWEKGRLLLVLLLSLMSVRVCVCGALGAALVCARAPGLTDRQRALCRATPAAMPPVRDGLRLAYAECAAQMRGRRWNCSGVNDNKHFGHVISMATREAAFTYAITSAGVAHALSAACARGDLPMPPCGCNHRRDSIGVGGVGSEQWQWSGGGGGCGAGGGAAGRGARLARRFLDARELEHDARAAMNLHNNRLGRKLVKELVRRECRCHGVSGSCAARTCWRALPPFRRVAAALADKYHHAKKVTAVERGTTLDGRVNLQLVVLKGRGPKGAGGGGGGGGRLARKSELVFLAESPSYCEPQPAAAALGTHHRLCNITSSGEDGCAHLCCGRGFSTRRVTSRVQCRCSFQWCCRVRCDSCLVTADHHVCN